MYNFFDTYVLVGISLVVGIVIFYFCNWATGFQAVKQMFLSRDRN